MHAHARNTAKWIVLPLLTATSLAAHAAESGDSIKSQLDALEKRQQEEIQALKKRLSEVDLRALNNSNKIKQALREQDNRLQIHGFMSAYAVKAERDVDHTHAGYGSTVNFNPNTRFGTQFDYNVAPSVDAVLQITAKGYESDNFSPRTEWAFLRYEASDAWMFRAGRMRMPSYLFSETSDVGYSYPWARLPLEIYLKGFENFNGGAVNYRFRLADLQNDLQLSVGTNNDATHEATVHTRNQAGIALNTTIGPVLLHASHTYVGSVAIESPSIAEDNIRVNYDAVGARFDNGKLLVIAEGVSYEPTRAAPILGQTSESLLVGWRFGKWLPYVNIGHLSTTGDQEQKAVDYYTDAIRSQLGTNVYNSTYDRLFALATGNYAQADASATAGAQAIEALALAEFDNTMAYNKDILLSGGDLSIAGQGVHIPAQFVQADMRSITLGTRWDIMPNVDVKIESAYYYDMKGTGGTWGDREQYETQRAVLQGHQALFSVGLDAAF